MSPGTTQYVQEVACQVAYWPWSCSATWLLAQTWAWNRRHRSYPPGSHSICDLITWYWAPTRGWRSLSRRPRVALPLVCPAVQTTARSSTGPPPSGYLSVRMGTWRETCTIVNPYWRPGSRPFGSVNELCNWKLVLFRVLESAICLIPWISKFVNSFVSVIMNSTIKTMIAFNIWLIWWWD